MGPENKSKYLGLIDKEVDNAHATIARLEKDRNNADGKMQSRYDTQKEDLARDIDVREALLAQTRAFRGVVESAEPTDQVVPGAEMVLTFTNSPAPMNALFSPVTSSLLPVQVITPKSPIGAAIQGLKAGTDFSYQVNGNTIRGTIQKVE